MTDDRRRSSLRRGERTHGALARPLRRSGARSRRPSRSGRRDRLPPRPDEQGRAARLADRRRRAQAALATAVPATRTTVSAGRLLPPRGVGADPPRLRARPTFRCRADGHRGAAAPARGGLRADAPAGDAPLPARRRPGAGKTIMAGLLMKELRLRGIVERVLVLCPAPLTIQWQDELSQKFDESFELMTSRPREGDAVDEPVERVPALHRLDRPREAAGGARAAARGRLGSRRHRRGAQVLGAHRAGDKVSKTQRYQLVERLSPKTERLLLLTATPHQGNADQFGHFLRLLDEDQFIDLERDKKVIQLEGNPWYLRRMKEDLQGLRRQAALHRAPRRHAAIHPRRRRVRALRGGHRLHQRVPRRAFRASSEFVYALDAHRVPAAACELARRRSRARSPAATSGSSEMLAELDALPESERGSEARAVPPDPGAVDDEMESDDETDEEQEILDRLRDRRRVDRAAPRGGRRARASRQARARHAGRRPGGEARRPQACLERAEFAELKDGRGKLLIFTEHKDTLDYLVEKLEEWGYTTTTIHGGMSPQEREAAAERVPAGRRRCASPPRRPARASTSSSAT